MEDQSGYQSEIECFDAPTMASSSQKRQKRKVKRLHHESFPAIQQRRNRRERELEELEREICQRKADLQKWEEEVSGLQLQVRTLNEQLDKMQDSLATCERRHREIDASTRERMEEIEKLDKNWMTYVQAMERSRRHHLESLQMGDNLANMFANLQL